MADLDPLFRPRSIAIIGASARPYTIGNRLIANLRRYDFAGPVYPVNPGGKPILGLETSRSILEVPGEVDLAHVVVRNTLVLPTLEDCARKGVKVAIVNTSGFGEAGPGGVELERQLVEVGRRTGVRIFGPNCQGVMNSDPDVRLYSNFTFATLRPGHVSMVFQGGGLAEVINNSFGMNEVGQRFYASNGNACDISIPEILEYYGDDDETHVIVLHVESFSDPAEFLARVRPVAARKPILALKSGTTEEGARAVSSHTGGLMQADTVTDALFDKCGILRFHRIADLCEAAAAFASQPVPRGNRIGMVTNAGSPAIVLTDEAVGAGLAVPDLQPETQAALAEKLQSIASVANPIDMMATASGDEFAASLDALLGDPGIDAAAVCFMTPFFVDTLSIADAVVQSAARTDKTLLAVAMTNPDEKPEWKETVARVRSAGVPVYYYPESAASVLAAMDRFRRLRDRERPPPPALDVDRAGVVRILDGAAPGPDGFLGGAEVSAILRGYGLPLVAERRGRTWDEVRAAAEAVGWPVVLKAEAPTLVHKTELGGVVLGLGDEAALQGAFEDLCERLGVHEGLGFLVQRQVAGGVEVIVGGARAPGLGSMVMFGLGGIFVEVLEDVVFKLAPLCVPEAGEMLDGIEAAALLGGVRGRAPADRGALVDLLVRVSRLLADHPRIAELDLNPVLALPEGAWAVDARIKVEAP